MRSFKSNENIHKKEGGSYYVVSANKASSVTLQSPSNESQSSKRHNSKHIYPRVMVLAFCKSSIDGLYVYDVPAGDLERFFNYRADTNL